MEEPESAKVRISSKDIIKGIIKGVLMLSFSIFIMLVGNVFDGELTALLMMVSFFMTLFFFYIKKIFVSTDESFSQIFRETLAVFAGIAFMIGMFNLVSYIFTSHVPLP